MIINRKFLSGLIGLVVILISLVIVFLVNYFNKDLYIMNGKLVFNEEWGTWNREDCIQVSRYIERYIHNKYNIANIRVREISLTPPISFGGNYGVFGPVYRVSVYFEDNNYIKFLEDRSPYLGHFNIDTLHPVFKAVSRDKCVEFSEKVEALVKTKYKEDLTVKSILPVYSKNNEKVDFYYEIYFENDYVAEVIATNKKIFDIKSISSDESIVFK